MSCTPVPRLKQRMWWCMPELSETWETDMIVSLVLHQSETAKEKVYWTEACFLHTLLYPSELQELTDVLISEITVWATNGRSRVLKTFSLQLWGGIKFWLYMHRKGSSKIYVIPSVISFLRIVLACMFFRDFFFAAKQRWIVILSTIWQMDQHPCVSLIVQRFYTCMSLARSNIHCFCTVAKSSVAYRTPNLYIG
jgi:hypothetical protein